MTHHPASAMTPASLREIYEIAASHIRTNGGVPHSSSWQKVAEIAAALLAEPTLEPWGYAYRERSMPSDDRTEWSDWSGWRLCFSDPSKNNVGAEARWEIESMPLYTVAARVAMAAPTVPKCGSQGLDKDGHCVICGYEPEGATCNPGYLNAAPVTAPATEEAPKTWEQNRTLPPEREGLCMICDCVYLTWYAPNDLWNAYERQPDGSDVHPFLCPTCFAKRASAEPGIFVLTTDDRIAELRTPTRVTDADRGTREAIDALVSEAWQNSREANERDWSAWLRVRINKLATTSAVEEPAGATEADDLIPTGHRIVLVQEKASVFCSCSCGWRGDTRESRIDASVDGAEHVEAVLRSQATGPAGAQQQGRGCANCGTQGYVWARCSRCCGPVEDIPEPISFVWPAVNDRGEPMEDYCTVRVSRLESVNEFLRALATPAAGERGAVEEEGKHG